MNMKIKRYLEFIKESISGFDSKYWTLERDLLEDIFIDFIDDNYIIDIEFGFLEKKIRWIDYEKVNTFSNRLRIGENKSAYWIYIYAGDSKFKNFDESIYRSFNLLKNLTKEEIYLRNDDDEDILDPKISSLNIIFGDKTFNLTGKYVCDHYKISYDRVDDNGDVYVKIDFEDIVDIFINGDGYKKELKYGINSDYIGAYETDIISLYSYYLNDKNKMDIVKSIIKEYDGLSNFLKELDNEFINYSEKEIIDFIINERFYNVLNIFKDSETMEGVMDIYCDYNYTSTMDKNYKELLSDFNNRIDDTIEYNIIEENEIKYYEIKLKDIYLLSYYNHNTSPASNLYTTFYLNDFGFYNGLDISDIFKSYVYIEEMKFKLNPNFSDYGGDINKIDFNSSIKEFLLNR